MDTGFKYCCIFAKNKYVSFSILFNMQIHDLATNVRFSADTNAYEHIKAKFNENSTALYEYCENNVDELLSQEEGNAFLLGMAFYEIVIRLEEPKDLDDTDDNTKFKFSLAAAIISLHKSMEMGTVQSCIAASHLYDLIYKFQYSITEYTMALTDDYVKEIIMDADKILAIKPIPGDGLTKAKGILKFIAYYVGEYSKMDNFKNSNMDDCKIGSLYLYALHFEMRKRFDGFKFFGIF